jgi:hypothetical protein
MFSFAQPQKIMYPILFNEKIKAALSCCVFIVLSACDSAPGAPQCRASQASFHEGSVLADNLACLIILKDTMVVVIDAKDEQMMLPGGGVNGSLTNQCALHRNIWQQTAMNVEIAEPLGWLEPATQVFKCHAQPAFDEPITSYPFPSWTDGSAEQLYSVNPFDLQRAQWGRGNQLYQLRDLYVKALSLEPERNSEIKPSITQSDLNQ